MLGSVMGVSDYLDRVCQEIRNLDAGEIETLSEVIDEAYRKGRFVFVIGNGGSGANASHLSEDLAKCTLKDLEKQKRLKILSLTDNTPWIMAIANDISYERIFIEQLKNLGSAGDVVVAISGSGNSPNILRAVEWANENGLVTVGITGFSGGKLRTLAKHSVHAPIHDMGMAESLHSVLFHWVVDDLYRRISGPIEDKEAVMSSCCSSAR
jgi:D-sedoheptulose 7-phosphate isomerase